MVLTDNGDKALNLINELQSKKVKLVAVSKTKPISSILNFYNSGHKVFGENRVQELIEKQKQLPANIEWHLIGHLQSNKVKHIASFIHLIHSVDSLKLLETIDKEAQKNKRIINCLLQIYIAQEETKYGLSFDEARELLSAPEFLSLQNIRISGLMGMATFTADEKKVRQEFRSLSIFFREIKETFFANNPQFKELSMGMSDDYKIAIEEGSTMVRIGSLLFGKRIN